MRNLLATVVFSGMVFSGATGPVADGQTLVEGAAGAGVGTVAGASGKKVSEGVSGIFGKVNAQTSAAAAGSTSKSPAAAPSKTPAVQATASQATASQATPSQATAEQATRGPAGPPAPPLADATAGPKPVRKPKPAAPVSANAVPKPRTDDVPPPPPLRQARTRVAAKPAAAPVQVAVAAPVRPPAPPPPPAMTLEGLQKVASGMSREELLKLGRPASRISMFDDGSLLEIYTYYSHDRDLGTHTIGTVRLNDGAVSAVQLRP